MKKQAVKLPELEIAGVGLIAPGVYVEHPHFGPGVVEEIYILESGENGVRVNFVQYGSKMLLVKFAKLTLVEHKSSTPGRLGWIFEQISKIFKS